MTRLVLCLVAFALAAQGSKLALSEFSVQASSPEIKLCNPCIQLGEQGLNILLNEILNAGVIGGCSKLCSGLNGTARTACNIVCDVVGIKGFIKALNHTDLDPIYFCQKLNA